MQSELHPLVRLLSLKRSRSGDRSLFRGTLGRAVIVATTTGIGTRAAARTTEQVLDSISVQHLAVVGIAGGIGPSVAIGDLVVPELVIDVATGAEYRPRVIADIVVRGTLATSNKVLSDPTDAARLERQGVIAVDMETTAIAAICESRACPWSVFRAISDCVGDGSLDPAMSGLVRPDGEPDIPALVQFMLTHPRRIPHLVWHGRNLRLATNAAASGAVNALGKM
jgi:adenosylhomocysteine nucleosidase